MLPAPGQGALGIECREDDRDTSTLLKLLDDAQARCEVEAERAFARELGGSCHSPVAAMACVDHRQIHLRAEILSEDGKERVRRQAHFPLRDTKFASKLARDMLADAPDSIRKLFRSE